MKLKSSTEQCALLDLLQMLKLHDLVFVYSFMMNFFCRYDVVSAQAGSKVSKRLPGCMV